MKVCFTLLALTASLTWVQAQPSDSFPLWAGVAPGALGPGSNDVPTLTAFLPDANKATGAAMVICPGGGYGGLAPHEGKGYALWFKEHGVAGFVLKYRLGSAGYRHPVMLQDAARAVRTLRARAGEWRLDPKRIGIIGSSAGGHLASTLVTHFDSGKPDAPDPIERFSSRPDLGILCYAVITMGEYTHQGSRNNLLGQNPSPELVREVSNELQVTRDTPPCFIWHTAEDRAVSVENALLFSEALRKAGVPFDLHIYERGNHGMGLGSQPYGGGEPHPWTRDCLFWLKQREFLK